MSLPSTLWKSTSLSWRPIAIDTRTIGCQTSPSSHHTEMLLCVVPIARKQYGLNRRAAILKLLGTTEKTLQCEGHPSLFHTVNHERVECDFSPGPLMDDCSGEHAGMIAGTKALGADATDYHLPHYHITCSHFANSMGCRWLQPFYSRFATQGLQIPIRSLLKLLIHPKNQHPLCVGKRMQCPVYPTRRSLTRKCLLVKITFALLLAERLAIISLANSERMGAMDSTEYLGARGFIDVAVKVEDGSVEIACAVVPKLLERLQISTVGMREKLRNYRCFERSNTAGVVTGKAHFPPVLLKTPTLSPALDSRGHPG
ncbi:hypothetical protein D6D10_08670 [Aureobasidium pullulans]|uniref:Uncharacterized protein n=1 Tax=Aureobasidium pullulans TaxID=5580 RepID=A0A4S9EAC9_AURPU|nr:hypothetical protein D6D10_08670 [Aureobasidium pullulans]